MTGNTSLRHQISLRIMLFSLVIMVLGGSIAVWRAREAVNEEVESSINLALQLIKLGSSAGSAERIDVTDWLRRLGELKQTRHLRIQLETPQGRLRDMNKAAMAEPAGERPPQWFVKLVGGEYPQARHRIASADGEPLTLIVQANPMDEITEAWQETLAFFVTILTLILLTFLAVHLVFNKTLRAIDIIVDTLQSIETGDYGRKLPEFATREYDSIARAINHLTEVLDTTRRKNRALTQHSLRIQEQERQLLSQELHDELGQSLTAVKVMAAAAGRASADQPEIMRSIGEICDHLMTVVRSMMRQLHPLMLNELGLKATLEELAANWRERNRDLQLTLQCEEAVDTLDDDVAIQLFRVIQECLTNINRHADAGRVEIRLELEHNGRVRLEVADDGRGCDIEKVSPGFGLLGMQERIKSLDGEFSMQSRPGNGMKINATIPSRR